MVSVSVYVCVCVVCMHVHMCIVFVCMDTCGVVQVYNIGMYVNVEVRDQFLYIH